MVELSVFYIHINAPFVQTLLSTGSMFQSLQSTGHEGYRVA